MTGEPTFYPSSDADVDDATERLAVGQVVGDRYRVEALLATGGYAKVYLASNVNLPGTKLVLKELRASAALAETVRERFRGEARAASRLQSDGILPVVDIVTEEGRGDILVMPYMDGGDLAAEVARRAEGRQAPISAKSTAAIFARVADALAVSHTHGIIHRDIKPQNILVRARDVVEREGLADWGAKLTDFGVARLGSAPVALTSQGTHLGTDAYMAPEHAASAANATERSDIYSLGASIYRVSTGGRLSDFDLKKVPRELRAIVKRCRAENPSQRYENAAQVARALRSVARPGLSPVWGVLAVLVAVLLGLSLYKGRKEPGAAVQPPAVVASVASAQNGSAPSAARCEIAEGELRPLRAQLSSLREASNDGPILAVLDRLAALERCDADNAELRDLQSRAAALPSVIELGGRLRDNVRALLRTRALDAEALGAALEQWRRVERRNDFASLVAARLAEEGRL